MIMDNQTQAAYEAFGINPSERDVLAKIVAHKLRTQKITFTMFFDGLSISLSQRQTEGGDQAMLATVIDDTLRKYSGLAPKLTNDAGEPISVASFYKEANFSKRIVESLQTTGSLADVGQAPIWPLDNNVWRKMRGAVQISWRTVLPLLVIGSIHDLRNAPAIDYEAEGSSVPKEFQSAAELVGKVARLMKRPDFVVELQALVQKHLNKK
jgi:hypothetical protein